MLYCFIKFNPFIYVYISFIGARKVARGIILEGLTAVSLFEVAGVAQIEGLFGAVELALLVEILYDGLLQKGLAEVVVSLYRGGTVGLHVVVQV